MKQLALAVQNYSSVHRESLPPYVSENAARLRYLQTYSGPQGAAQYWFGVVDFDQADPALQLQFANGPLAPYLETNQRVFQCPDLGPSVLDTLRFGAPTTGYGYNGYYLARASGIVWLPPTWAPQPSTQPLNLKLRDVQSSSQTLVFADSAQVKLVRLSPTEYSFEENWILDPPSRNYPTAHFRHQHSANVAFLDGHVATYAHAFHVEIPGDNFLFTEQARLMQSKLLGFISNGNLQDEELQDELYDRN